MPDLGANDGLDGVSVPIPIFAAPEYDAAMLAFQNIPALRCII